MRFVCITGGRPPSYLQMRVRSLLPLAAVLATQPWLCGCSGSAMSSAEPGWRVNFASPEGSVQVNAMALGPDDSVYLAGDSVRVPPGENQIDHANQVALVVKLASDGRQLWRKDFDGVPTRADWNSDNSRVVAVDPEGNVVVAGQFNGTIDLGGGPRPGTGFYDLYLTKLDPDGNHLWSMVFGGDGEETPNGLVIDEDGSIYLSGHAISSNVDLAGHPTQPTRSFLARFDSDGHLLWERVLSSDLEAWAEAAVRAAGGGVVLAGGWRKGTLDLGGTSLTSAGSYDAFLASVDPQGGHRWHLSLPSPGDPDGFNLLGAVARDAQGGLVAVASFLGRKVTIGGRTFDNRTNGNFDDVIVRLSADGQLQWTSQLEARTASLAVGADGEIWTAGSFQGTSHLGASALHTHVLTDTDIVVARLDSQGHPLDAAALPDHGLDVPVALALGRDGARVVAGLTGASPGNAVRAREAFAAKLR
jgi:hypothetical protein